MIKITICEHQPYYAKGLCEKCYRSTPKYRKMKLDYYNLPERVKKRRAYTKEYNQRPEIKERIRLRNQRPEIKERIRLRNQTPEWKEEHNKWQREYYRTHPEMRLKNAENQREWQKRHPNKWRDYKAKTIVKKIVKTVDETPFIRSEFTDAFVKGSTHLDKALEEVGTEFKQDFGTFFEKKKVDKIDKKET